MVPECAHFDRSGGEKFSVLKLMCSKMNAINSLIITEQVESTVLFFYHTASIYRADAVISFGR